MSVERIHPDSQRQVIGVPCVFCKKRPENEREVEVPHNVAEQLLEIFESGWMILGVCSSHGELVRKYGIEIRVQDPRDAEQTATATASETGETAAARTRPRLRVVRGSGGSSTT